MKTVSNNALDFLTEFEGDIHYAYNDPVGYCTAARGRLLHTSGCTQADYAKYGTKSNPKLTEQQTADMLRSDLKLYEAAVRQHTSRRTSQEVFDAFVIIAYNIGVGGFAGSTFLKRFNDGAKLREVAEAMLWWCKAGNPPKEIWGLKRRRIEETEILRRGDYAIA